MDERKVILDIHNFSIAFSQYERKLENSLRSRGSNAVDSECPLFRGFK